MGLTVVNNRTGNQVKGELFASVPSAQAAKAIAISASETTLMHGAIRTPVIQILSDNPGSMIQWSQEKGKEIQCSVTGIEEERIAHDLKVVFYTYVSVALKENTNPPFGFSSASLTMSNLNGLVEVESSVTGSNFTAKYTMEPQAINY